MPSLNLILDDSTNTKLNELVIQLSLRDPLRNSNRSHAARVAIVEMHKRYLNNDTTPRTLETDIEEDR